MIDFEKKGRAFTLAEVLITLSILGIVAAISIPNMVQQYQKRLTITKLQRAYAFLENAAQNIAINSGCISQNLNCTGLYNLVDSDTYGSKDFTKRFLELANVKGYEQTRKNNYIKARHINCSVYSQECSYNNIFRDYFTTQDGLLYSIRTARRYDIEGDKAIIVFVGTTKPKKDDTEEDRTTYQLGRNMFLFTIYDNFIVEPVSFYSTSGTVLPASKGNNSINTKCNPKGSGTGQGTSCAARIIKNGWKIDY